jgi:hypothetical protein
MVGRLELSLGHHLQILKGLKIWGLGKNLHIRVFDLHSSRNECHRFSAAHKCSYSCSDDLNFVSADCTDIYFIELSQTSSPPTPRISSIVKQEWENLSFCSLKWTKQPNKHKPQQQSLCREAKYKPTPPQLPLFLFSVRLKA